MSLTDTKRPPPPGATVEQMIELLKLPDQIAAGIDGLSDSTNDVVDSAANAQVNLVEDGPGVGSPTILRILGAGWVAAGVGSISFGWALAAGIVVATAPVSVAGMIIFGVGAVVIGSTYWGIAGQIEAARAGSTSGR